MVGHKMIGVKDNILLYGGGVWSSDAGWTDQFNDTHIYDSSTCNLFWYATLMRPPVRNSWKKVKSDTKPGISTYPYIFK